MSVSAKFEADFTQFNSAVTGADANLRVLEGNAAKVGPTIQKAGADAGKTFGDMGSSLASLAGAFGIVFSIGAVVSFGKELLATGDALVRVADRTGLTTTEVQRLSFVAAQSGNSIEELTGAIGQMQNRLASGDKPAIQAVKELGINFETLVHSSPADQLGMIATAIAKIPDPATRTAIAMDLFGKMGTAILPTLTSQFEKVAAAAPLMSDATVRSLDQAGDAMGRFGLGIKVFSAEAVVHLMDATSALEKFAFWAAGMHPPVEKFSADAAMLSLGQDHLTDTVHKTNEQLAAEAQAIKDADAAAKQLADDAYTKLIGATNAQGKALADQATKWKEAEAASWAAGKAGVKAEEEVTAATKKQNDELAAQKKLADEAAAANHAMGGSFSITRENFAASARGLGGNADAVEILLKKGYSFEQALLYSKHPEWPEPHDKGPRVPGFAGGGPTSEGPAYLHDDEYVVPKGGALVMRGEGSGGSRGTATTIIQLVVDGRVLASIVNEHNMRSMMQGRKLSAAA